MCGSSNRVRWVPCHHGMARPQFVDYWEGPQIWRAAANILNKQLRLARKGWTSWLGLGAELTTAHRKNKLVTKDHKKPQTWTDSLDKRPKRNKMDMRFCTWNVRSMYRAASLTKCKLDLVGVQAVRWDGGGTEPAGECTFFCGKGNENHELVTGSFVHKRIMSEVKSVEFVCDRMLYIILRGRWRDIIVLNVHAPTEDKNYDMKDRIYEELEHFVR
jgi:hypothetical protein